MAYPFPAGSYTGFPKPAGLKKFLSLGFRVTAPYTREAYLFYPTRWLVRAYAIGWPGKGFYYYWLGTEYIPLAVRELTLAGK